ncbi:Putative beta-eliminating lyase [Hirsutella minnesotensis 3608]|uniref:Putative beta-eliminating lyase n=1 Tax=Hirsutella minnesotensis 3608 TaxID=1043627 RepID=A0A0F7ZFR2_9HYPO|nr:Putative beta-eliminating lyase [Hirsutella minnesotensis 3608]
MVERIRPSTREERLQWITESHFNLFNLHGDQVYIDLLTDSGTGAMSDQQWAAIMKGDETYAGSSSFLRLRDKVKEIFGFDYVLPVHQGRAAENALFSAFVGAGNIVPGNSHFDTTRAHIENRGAHAYDCSLEEAFRPDREHPFKGNVDIDKLDTVLKSNQGNVPMIVVTATCNKSGGQPVSLSNLRRVKELADIHGIPLVIDSARFAENAWFIREREPGYADKSIKSIVREMYQLADAMIMSGKKDGLVNIGGLLATRHQIWYDRVSSYVILFEGFTTYGGLAGRDMEAFAVGLGEVTDSHYLDSRIGQVHRLGRMLIEAGIPIQRPIGGHAIIVDATTFLPYVPREEYPAQTLAVELYVEAGVRGVEIGTLLNDRDPCTGEQRYAQTEFLRLAIPRRVYTNDHLAVVGSGLKNVFARRASITVGRLSIHIPYSIRALWNMEYGIHLVWKRIPYMEYRK